MSVLSAFMSRLLTDIFEAEEGASWSFVGGQLPVQKVLGDLAQCLVTLKTPDFLVTM